MTEQRGDGANFARDDRFGRREVSQRMQTDALGFDSGLGGQGRGRFRYGVKVERTAEFIREDEAPGVGRAANFQSATLSAPACAASP